MKIADDWLRQLPQQFQDKKNIEILIRAFADEIQELTEVFEEIRENCTVDKATGTNLDMEGSIVGLTRKEAGELADYPMEVMADERYRQFLKYKILLNTSGCTYYDLMEGLQILWDVSPIYYMEDPALPATIILTMPFLTPGGETVTLGDVPMVKPGGVQVVFQYKIRVAVETLVKWIMAPYNLPRCGSFLCGTWPGAGSLGKIIYMETNADLTEIWKVFDATLAGTIRVGGVAYESTSGQLITKDVEIELNRDMEVVDLLISGQRACGTFPIRAANGFSVSAATEAGEGSSSVQITTVNHRACGTIVCGK